MAQEIPEQLGEYLNRCCEEEHIAPFFLKVSPAFFILIDDSGNKLLIND